MKKLALLAALAFIPSVMLGNCEALMQKYNAPDPGSKTMAQISRWISSKVDDSNDAKTLETCMVARAADNPNKEQVAGK
ncbi:hypothetical protein [uncultured Helicobacter sp.]|uniref:hypothetical protein n=1 Tax=uncultured Helicobacter sp. TaxID=175537 RepID=UPI001C3B8DC6|nr:hypothetical protein [Candidatus Helicobacter avicola]